MEPELFVLEECFRSFAILPDAMLVDDAAVCGVTTGISHAFFNGVGATRTRDPRVIAASVARFKAAGQPFRWWIAPAEQRPELPALLEANGLRYAYDATAMAATLPKAKLSLKLPKGVTIVRATSMEELQTWARVLLTGFGLPMTDMDCWLNAYDGIGLDEYSPWAHFIAFLDGQPVATSSVLIRQALAGIYHVVTLPDVRGRGIGAAVTAAAMRYAYERGATEGALQASALGLSVYRALGFVAKSDMKMFLWNPEWATA